MKLFGLFQRRASAPVARERLQILLAHERNGGCNSDLISLLQKEVLEVVSRHVSIDPDKVALKIHRRETVSSLAIDIEIPPSVAFLQPNARASDRTVRLDRAG
jgi:cell division topological specificity factor